MADSRICSIDGCDKKAVSRGWCTMHYARWRKHGDASARGCAANGEPLAFLENASSYQGGECLLWPFSKNDAGYGKLYSDGRLRVASNLMCEKVHGPAPSAKHEAAHSCGRGHDGCITPGHLRWATRRENCADKILHGTLLLGEAHPNSKLSSGEIEQIRMDGGLQREIAARFGIAQTAVSNIKNYKRRAHS